MPYLWSRQFRLHQSMYLKEFQIAFECNFQSIEEVKRFFYGLKDLKCNAVISSQHNVDHFNKWWSCRFLDVIPPNIKTLIAGQQEKFYISLLFSNILLSSFHFPTTIGLKSLIPPTISKK